MIEELHAVGIPDTLNNWLVLPLKLYALTDATGILSSSFAGAREGSKPQKTRRVRHQLVIAFPLSGASHLPYRLPYPRRRRRHVEMLHAERRQRVHHGVHDGGGRGDRAGLSAALDAEAVGAAGEV
jgi:hypothetical protein